MAIDYRKLKAWKFEDQVNPYTERDCILYALGLGYGGNPLDAAELPFVYEERLKVVPTLFAVVGAPGAWAADPATGIDWLQILHGEHRMTPHAPAAPSGTLRSRTRVSPVIDKGVGRGALVVTERVISEEGSGKALATIEHVSFCRADGGIGETDEPLMPLPPVPDVAPEYVVSLPTAASAALLYRLNGDRNPIHADPQAAGKAGFDRPILHGLCTYGMAARAILGACCDNLPEQLGSLSLRFSAPFYPGETLRVELWRRGRSVHFRAIADERNVVVLTHGLAVLNG